MALRVWILATALSVAPLWVSAEEDPATGLTIAENWETVRNNCIACHSAKLITQQRASRDTWEQMIRWMQATQGLWEFDEATETQILDYLADNYPPGEAYRRKPLSFLMLPENPYGQ